MTTTESAVWRITKKTDGTHHIALADSPLDALRIAQEFDVTFALNNVRVECVGSVTRHDGRTNGGQPYGSH